MNKLIKRQNRGQYHCKVCQSSDIHNRPSQHWENDSFHIGVYYKDYFVKCTDECLHCNLSVKGKNSPFVDNSPFVELGLIQKKRWRLELQAQGLEDLHNLELEVP